MYVCLSVFDTSATPPRVMYSDRACLLRGCMMRRSENLQLINSSAVMVRDIFSNVSNPPIVILKRNITADKVQDGDLAEVSAV